MLVVSCSHTRARRLAAGLQEYGLSAYYTEDLETALVPGQIAVTYGHASRGFAYPHASFALIAESDIFGEKKVRKRRKVNPSGEKIAAFSELHAGDYVVHENHGLGIYRGIEKVETDGVLKDYIKIEYNGSNLYILATQLDLLQKYAGGAEGARPKLNRLGGQEWQKTRTKVRSAVKNIAGELVRLYAARQENDGYVYGPDTEWQREFEEMFPFEETEDQLAAIEDTKRDMESRRCGIRKNRDRTPRRVQGRAGGKAGRVSCADDNTGSAALQYFHPENEGFPGAGGSPVPFPHRCAAGADDT